MLHAHRSPSQKRRDLRAGLASGRLLRLPGAFIPLNAMLIERKGFEGVYVSGGAFAAALGVPDIGLTSATEVAQHAAQIARTTALPTIVDADTGFGEPMNVARTVHLMEDAGVAAMHLEDQVNPKRCGHLDGKDVVDGDTAVKRIRAAVAARRDPDFLLIARTDIRGVDSFEATIERSRMLVDAGAEVIFPEALRSVDEFARLREAVGVPVLANVTEFGKSELFTHAALERAGVSMVIHPVSLLRLAMGAADRALDELASDGTLDASVSRMQTRADLYDLLDYGAYGAFDDSVYSFDLANNVPA